MKKTALLLTVLMLIPSIFACGGNEDVTSGATDTSVTDGMAQSQGAEETQPQTEAETEPPMFDPEMIESDKTSTAKLFDTTKEKEALSVNPGSVNGQRVHINAPFKSFSVSIPTWNSRISTCSLAVYRWRNSYTETISREPLAKKEIKKLSDGGTYSISFDPLPAGEYLLAVCDATSSVGVWAYKSNVSEGYFYSDGVEKEYDAQITVRMTMTPKTPVTECVSVYEITDRVTVPEEPVISADDILNTRDAFADTWVAIDALGREVATNATTGGVKDTKQVGLFYWSWHASFSHSEPFNVNNFMLENPEAKNDFNHPGWPSASGGVAYFWNEPLYGYYSTTDSWVLRRHAELLAAAGVDVIFFDNSNGDFTWLASVLQIMKVFSEARADGVNVPKISFLLPFGPNDGSRTQLRSLYVNIFRTGLYQDLWYYRDGKPMLMAHSSNLKSNDRLDAEILRFFTFRAGQPVYNSVPNPTNQWGWLSIYPQQKYYAQRVLEQMTVGVAQNWSTAKGCTAMNGEDIFGRSYTSTGYHTEPDATLYGYNLAEQFEYAIESDPQFIFITGWNEWTAGRQETWGGVSNAFADQFNDEYSRDIEPTKGALGDNYYYQMVSYIRRFKGTRALPEASGKKTIDITSTADMWADVLPYYVAYRGNTFDRDANGYGTTYYTDTTGRNDIIGAKIAHDDTYVYFMVECAENITSPEGAWMRLYLDTVSNANGGWESFEYVINKSNPVGGRVSVDSFTGTGFETTSAGEGEYTVSGNRMQIKIAKATLGISGDSFTINFKWNDNGQADGDIMDFYISGDTAPLGRFKYQYIA